MQKFTANEKIKLSAFLLDKYQGGLSYGKFCKLLKNKDVKINGTRVNKDCALSCGDIVECYFDGEKAPLQIVYKDENVVVFNKPVRITAEDFYTRVCEEFSTAIFTHRLDRNTSGLIIFALNQKAYEELFEGFKQRTFKKYYYCLVNGAFEQKKGELKDYLVKDEQKGEVKVYNNKVAGAKQIITQYEEVARGEYSSVLKVELVTGRTHQIRAHLAYHGHFIIGDGKYGAERVNKLFKVRSQLLIASILTLYFKKESFLYYLNEKTFFVDNKRVFDYLK